MIQVSHVSIKSVHDPEIGEISWLRRKLGILL